VTTGQCGDLFGTNGFFCPDEQAIYLSSDLYSAGFGRIVVIAHEWGHLNDFELMLPTDQLSELRADCWAGALLGSADEDEMVGTAFGDPDVPGTWADLESELCAWGAAQSGLPGCSARVCAFQGGRTLTETCDVSWVSDGCEQIAAACLP